ncbi:MAG: hypothetical protein DMF84_30520 [Acidobacteria bacterium]|nr:MAG: hypothetical protein DMF84_30520 [Acidobacteriota bacterium]
MPQYDLIIIGGGAGGFGAAVLHPAMHHRIPGLDLSVTGLDVAAIVRDELALSSSLAMRNTLRCFAAWNM